MLPFIHPKFQGERIDCTSAFFNIIFIHKLVLMLNTLLDTLSLGYFASNLGNAPDIEYIFGNLLTEFDITLGGICGNSIFIG